MKATQTGITEASVIGLIKKVNNCIIRGVSGINYTEVISVAKSEIGEDGSISSTKVFAIQTNGSNLEDVLDNPYVDKYRTQTDSISEFEEMYGIEATREKIIREIRKAMTSDDVVLPHTSVFADEMTYSGKMTSIQRTGLQVREMNNVTLRLSFQSPVQVIENAAQNGLVDEISGVSGPLCVGQVPSVGTCYNNVSINEKFIENYMKNISKSIEDEL